MEDPQITALIRAIQDFRSDVKDDFALMREDIRHYTPRDVFEENKASVDRRLGVFERARETARNAIVMAIASGALSVFLLVSGIQEGK